MEYFAETMELTDEEREFFGIPKETDDYEDLEKEVILGEHPYLSPMDL